MSENIFDILTCVISAYINIKHWKLLTSSFANVIYLLFLILYVFPLFVDCLYEIPPYSNHYDEGFGASSLDETTRVIYDIFILYAQFLILRKIKQKKNVEISESVNVSFPNWMLYIGMIIPTLITIGVLQTPYMLYSFQWRELDLIEIPKFYWYVETFSYISITCCALLLCSRGNKVPTRILATVFMFMTICEQGKRAALFFALIAISLVLYYNYIQKSKTKTNGLSIFFVISFVLVVAQGMLSFTFQVQQERGYSEEVSNMVEMTRVDFLRDDRVRYSIYDELYNNGSILDYKGQSFVAEFCNAFPLMYVLGRYDVAQYKYQNMLSCSLVGDNPHNSDKQHMTPSIIGELVSNIGVFLGLLLSPFIIIWFIDKSRKYPYPLNAFIILCFTLLNLFSLTYIILFFEFTYVYILIYNKRLKNKKYENINLELS